MSYYVPATLTVAIRVKVTPSHGGATGATAAFRHHLLPRIKGDLSKHLSDQGYEVVGVGAVVGDAVVAKGDDEPVASPGLHVGDTTGYVTVP